MIAYSATERQHHVRKWASAARARFAFFLAAPIIGAAGVLKLPELFGAAAFAL